MSEYTDSVERETKGLEAVSVGLCTGCPECADSHGMEQDEFDEAYEAGTVCDEGSFSSQSCDTCGSNLAGDRYAAHAWDGETLVHMSACVDCLCFIANGDEPETWEA